jgi:DNA-directed RNA polymerase specialized sigma24 family protein
VEAAALPVVRPEERAHVRAGDREAFIRLYTPDLAGLFDLHLRTLRDRDQALAALDTGLARAWNEFREEAAPFDVRSWLYVLGREASVGHSRRRRPLRAEREAFEFTRVSPNRLSDPTAAFDRELIDLVWDEVRAYDREEYTLLDLHLRRDLSVQAISERLQVAYDQVAGRLSGLCERLNDDVSTTLLAARARHACSGLDRAQAGRTQGLRRVIRAHLRDCEACSATRQRFVPATEIFAALSLMAPPSDLYERTARALG